MDDNLTLAVLGCGNMGQAILRSSPRFARLSIFDPSDACRSSLPDLPAVTFADSAAAAAGQADVVLLAVKPQVMPALLEEIAPAAGGRLLVSIAAGKRSAFIEQRVPNARVVRAMPNTPLMAGKGVVALCPGASADPDDLEIARRVFPGAMLLDLPEDLMDAVTAISGSGPAYFFALVEALTHSARQQGFDAVTARRLAEGTFLGAAALLEQSGDEAAELRSRVTSPGGTTEAALQVLKQRGLAEAVAAAVAAGVQRGRDLSGEPPAG